MAGASCFVRLLALFPVFHLESRKQAFLCPNKTLQDKENMEEQMETYQELRTRQQKEVDALPLGFAFSEKQFEEMKAKLEVKENSELYRLGDTGGFYRKIDADLIIGTFKRHQEERQNAIFTANGINTVYVQNMIYYEMCNHEFAINHDGREALALFHPYGSEKGFDYTRIYNYVPLSLIISPCSAQDDQ